MTKLKPRVETSKRLTTFMAISRWRPGRCGWSPTKSTEQRIAAAVAAGGTVVDDSEAPALTVIADQDGNRGVVCIDAAAAAKD